MSNRSYRRARSHAASASSPFVRKRWETGHAKKLPVQDKRWSGVKTIFREVDWSISFVAFLVYWVIVVTYRFDGASIAIGTALAGLIFERRWRFPFWLIWFLAFISWGVVAYTQSAWPGVAWGDGVIEYGKIWLICLVAANVLTSGPRLRFFLIFFVVLYVTHPVRGALFNQFVYGYTEWGRAVWREAWSNPNDMAALTFLPLGIAAGLLSDRNDWVRKGALVSVAIMSFMIILTKSRGGFLALAIFVLLAVFNSRYRLRVLALTALLGIGSILLAPRGTFDRIEAFAGAVGERDVTQAEDSRSAEQRLDIWRVAQDVIASNPVFGVGMAVYPYAHGDISFRNPSVRMAGGRRDAHSTFLRVAAETGYPGLVIFLTPFIMAIVLSRGLRKRLHGQDPRGANSLKYLEAALVAYLIAAIFGSFAHTPYLWIHLGLVAMLGDHLRRRIIRPAPQRRHSLRGASPRRASALRAATP